MCFSWAPNNYHFWCFWDRLTVCNTHNTCVYLWQLLFTLTRIIKACSSCHSLGLQSTCLTVNLPLPFLILTWESNGKASSPFSVHRWKEPDCQIINILQEITPAMKYWKRKSQTWGHWCNMNQALCSYRGKKHTVFKIAALISTGCMSTINHSDLHQRNYS